MNNIYYVNMIVKRQIKYCGRHGRGGDITTVKRMCQWFVIETAKIAGASHREKSGGFLKQLKISGFASF